MEGYATVFKGNLQEKLNNIMLTSSLKWRGQSLRNWTYNIMAARARNRKSNNTFKMDSTTTVVVSKTTVISSPPTSGPARGCHYPASLGRHFPFVFSLCEQGLNPDPEGMTLQDGLEGVMLQDGPEEVMLQVRSH